MTTGDKRKLNARDILAVRTVSDPRISPDGRTVAWVRTWVETRENSYHSQLCLTDLATGRTRELTAGQHSETHPRWSPDGQYIAFLARPEAPSDPGPPAAPGYAIRDGGAQLHVMRVDGPGGSPRCLTSVRGGVAEPAWAPDGRRLVFTAFVHPDLGLEEQPLEIDTEDYYRRYNADVLVTRSAAWKFDGVGYTGDYRRQVAVVRFEEDGKGPGQAKLLTRGAFDLRNPTWSPDGRTLAVIGNTHPRADFMRQSFVYLLDPEADAPVTPRELFGLEEMRHSGLAWSPDGEQLAVCGHDKPGIGHYGNLHLWMVDASDGSGRCVTRGFDRTLGNAAVGDVRGYSAGERMIWQAGGVLTLVSDEGRVYVARVDRQGDFEPLTGGDRVVTDFSYCEAADRLVVLMTDGESTGDLYRVDSGRYVRLTNENAGLFEQVTVSRPTHFRVASDSVELDAWLIAPPDLEPDRTYPVVLYTGGGPGGMRGHEFMFEYQLLAAEGYAVVYCNTRGCQGYGEEFCTAILGSWGGADYEDNLRSLDEALERFDFLDPRRQAVAGGSYGGYQVNWALGHTDRFGAAVSDRSVFNRYSSYGTSDIGRLREFEFGGGPPWETTANYLAQSPMQFMADVSTPTLVVHSALDHRCPVEQGEQLFTLLKRLGVPSEFVRFPTESHGLSRGGQPWHRVFRVNAYLDWFRRWL